MSSRIGGYQNHAGQYAGQASQQGHASSQTQQSASLQRSKLQARLLQNKAPQTSVLFRNKRFATSLQQHSSPSGQKLVRQFGQRPTPAASAKRRDQMPAANDRNDRTQENEPPREREEATQEHEQREKQQQNQRQDQDPMLDQEDEHKHERDAEHGTGDESGQFQQDQEHSQDQDSQNGQQRHEQREKPRTFALSVTKIKPKAVLSNSIQFVAEQHRGSLQLPGILSEAYAKGVLEFTSQFKHGPLLAVPLLLSMTSRMVLKRTPARLRAHHNGIRAHAPAEPGKSAATAGLIGLSLDLTLARQRFGIEYSDDDQSLAAIKQRLINALGGTPVSAATSTTIASDRKPELRMGPVASRAKA
jgi:hypothetical protein